MYALIVALMAGLVPAAAHADGDPASDVLVTQPLFVPFDAGIPAAQQARLAALLQSAAHSDYQLRVALISSPADLGSVTELWGMPQSYAEFLGEELSLVYRGTLLVVMPNGLGVYGESGSPAPARAALAGLRPAHGGSALGSVALTAVERLAAASGHALSVPNGTLGTLAAAPRGGASDAVAWIVFAAGWLLIGLAWTASLRAKPLRLPGRSGLSIQALPPDGG